MAAGLNKGAGLSQTVSLWKASTSLYSGAAGFQSGGGGVTPADRFVTNDAELVAAVAAQPTPTTPWVIELADSGTFSARADLTGKTAITLRGQTSRVPVLPAGLNMTNTTNCVVHGITVRRIAPNSTAAYTNDHVIETGGATGLEIYDNEVSSNPLAGIAMQAGTSGSLYFQGYCGIGDSAGTTNSFNFHDNYVHDCFRGFNVQAGAGTTNYIERNTVIDCYQNPAEMAGNTGSTIYYRHNDTIGTWAISTDPGSPHSSTMGFSASQAWTPIVVGNKAIAAPERRFAAKGTYAAASGPKFNDPAGSAMNYVNGVFAYNLCTAQDGIGLEASFGNFTIVCNTVVKDNITASSLVPGFNYHDLGAGTVVAKNVFAGFQLNPTNVNGVHPDVIANGFDNVMLLTTGQGSPAVASGDLNNLDFHFAGTTWDGWTIANIVGRLTPKVGSFITSEGIGAVGTGYDWTARSYTSIPTFTKPKTSNASGTAPALTQFDGTNDWLQLTGTAPLIGMTNRRAWTVAIHATYDGSDATDCTYTESNGTDFTVRKLPTTGRQRFRVKNNANAAICEVDSSQLFVKLAADGSDVTKRLTVFTVNFTTGRVFVMRGKELDPFPTVTTLKADDINNARTSTAIMGASDTTPPTGTTLVNGRLGLFLMTDQFVDLGVAANHNSIVATDGTPADWGSNGSNFTGTQPRAFVYGDAAVINAGGGVNYGSFATKYIINGSVTNA